MAVGADLQRTGAEPAPAPAPPVTQTQEPESGTQLSPETPAESYSSRLGEPGGGNGGGMPRSQLINQLQSGYGNRYTGEVIEGVRQKSAGAGGAGEKEEKETETETEAKIDTKTGTPEEKGGKGKKGAGEKKTAAGKEKPAAKETKEKEKTDKKGTGEKGEKDEKGTGKEIGAGKEQAVPGVPGEKGDTESAEAAEEKEEEGKKEEKEGKGTGKKEEKEKKEKKKEPDKKGAKKEEPGAAEGAAEGPGGAAAFFLEAGAKAFNKVKQKIKRLGKNEKNHKSAKDKRDESEKAVLHPEEEPQSRANQGQVEAVNKRTAPGTNDKEARSTLDTEVKKATPKKIKHVDSFKSDGKAQAIRKMVMNNVRGQTQKVQQTYRDIGDVPEKPKPPAPPTIPDPEAAPPTGALQMGKELLPQLPEEMTDLSKYENEADDMVAREGLDPEELALVDSGPLAEANALRTKIKDKVQTAPGEIRQKEKDEKAVMEQELDADEKSSRTAMKVKRNNELGKVKETQETKKKSEEEKRKNVTDEIQRIFREAKNTVTTKLENLETESLKQFDDGQKTAADKFEDTVKTEMKAYKKSRYGGYWGWTKKAKDWALGMDDLPRVREIFNNAKNTFVGEINGLITTIINNSRQVITDCKNTIKTARDEIAALVEPLEPDLKKAAEAAQKEFTDRLDALDNKVNAKERELKEKLDERRKIAIKQIDEKIKKMKEEMSGALAKAGRLLLKGALKMLKWALKTAGAPVEEIMDFLRKAASAFWDIVKSPGAFLSNLVKALFGGFKQFRKNIVTHLKKGLMDWLFGTMAGGEITMPEDFSTKSIFGLVMQVLRVTPAVIKQKIAVYVGQENVERVEKVWGYISTFIQYGPGGLWEQVKEYISDLKERVIGGIRDWVKNQIIFGAIEYILGLFSPVSGIIKVAKMIYKVAKFIMQRIRQIIDVLKAIVNSLSDIASGAIGSAIDWIEKTLARMVPVAIGFLATLMNLSGISKVIREFIEKVRRPIHNALDKLIAKIAAKIAPLVAKVTAAGKKVVKKTKAAAGKVLEWWRTRKRFKNKSGETHTISFKGKGSAAQLMIFSKPKTVEEFLDDVDVSGDPGAKGKRTKALNIVKNIETITRSKVDRSEAVKITSKVNQLSGILMQLGGSPAPPAKAQYGYKSTPKTAFVNTLTADNKRAGSETSGTTAEDLKGWKLIRSGGLTTSGGNWVKMHMVSAQVGGKGDDKRNLIPAPTIVNSGPNVRSFEQATEDLVVTGTGKGKKKKKSQLKSVVWIETKVTGYHSKTTAYDGSTFVKSVSMNSGLYMYSDSAWKKDKTPRISEPAVTIEKPKFSRSTLPTISSPSHTALSKMEGGKYSSVFTGNAVKKIRLAKEEIVTAKKTYSAITQFNSVEHLDTRLKALSPKNQWQNKVKDIMKAVRKLYKAGKIRIR